jgi:hypothetical protein
MNGKEFGKEYMDSPCQNENYEYCIEVLEDINDQYKTDEAVKAIKQAQSITKNRIDEMEGFEVIEK